MKRPVVPLWPAPKPTPPAVSGVIRHEDGTPIAGAEVYLAATPEQEEGVLISEHYFRKDWFRRAAFARTTSDENGQYGFSEIPRFGEVTLSVFKAKHSSTQDRITIRKGETKKHDLKMRMMMIVMHR